MIKQIIKLWFIAILVLMVCFSCKKNHQLTFETTTLKQAPCSQCPEINITIPSAVHKKRIDNAINNGLKKEIIALLTFEDEETPTTIPEAITSFKNGYAALQKRFPDETTPWEAKIAGDITFEDKDMITIRLKSYLFTGGAHGYSTTRYLNFNKKKGAELANWELFANKNDFEAFAESKFRIQERIPKETPINSTGFMFDHEEFYLPDNIGFTGKGLELCYNQYEVASYADGPIVLTLPFKEVAKYLSFKN